MRRLGRSSGCACQRIDYESGSAELIQHFTPDFSCVRAEFRFQTSSLRWITSSRPNFSEISFVRIRAPLEPTRSNHQLRYIPTIARMRRSVLAESGVCARFLKNRFPGTPGFRLE